MGFKIAEAFVEIKASDDGLREDVRRKVDEAGVGQDIKVGLKVKDGAFGGLMANLAPFILPTVGALGQLTGVLGLVPAAAGAAGIAYGTVKVGISGFGDALKKADAAKNTQELNAALADLAPNARESALAVHNLEPAWNNLHLDVQQRLFQGVGKDIQRLGIVDLPVLRHGLDETAGSLNQGVHYFTAWATSSKTVGDLRTIMDNSAVSTQNLMRALQPVLSIVRDLATVGSSMLPGLSSGFASAAQHAADFVSHARDTGKLKEWIQTGIDATGQLFHILGDLVQIIIRIGQAPPLFGFSFLSALSTVTDLVLKLITDFPQLIPMIEAALVVWRAWTIAQWALNVAMDANPIGLVIGIIAALVAAVILVTGHIKDFTAWITQVGTSIMDAVLPVLKQLWDQIKTQLIPAFEAFIVALGPVVDFFVRVLGPVVKTVWDGISSVIKGAITVITGILQAFTGLLTGNWSLFWTGIENILRGSWQAIQGIIGAALNLVLGLFGTSTTQIRNDWNSFWNGVSSTASSVWNSVTGFLTNSMNSFRGFFSGVWNGIVGDFQNIWGRVTGIASSVWQGVYGAFRDGINQIIRFINGLVDDADVVLRFLLIPQIPHVPGLAGGGTVGAGFTTNGPMAIVGEGNPSHPEYVIPTDPAHRDNALALYQSLGAKLMAGGGILSKLESWTGSAATSTLNAAVDALTGAIPVGMFRNMAGAIGHKAVDAIRAMIEKASAVFSAAFTGSPDLAGWIQTALGLTGTPGSWAGPLSVLIGRESGGNPNAINRWDSNAAAGHPSQGLMQTIPSTFNAYHQPGTSWNILDPIANIAAGINYIKARYGTIFNVQQANPNLPPKGYDTGGLLPTGLTVAANRTGRPERVLSANQTAAFDRLVDVITKGRGAGGVTVNVTQTAGSPAETGRYVALALRTVG